jgi:hypothetical protein
MPKLDLTTARRMKGLGVAGEFRALKIGSALWEAEEGDTPAPALESHFDGMTAALLLPYRLDQLRQNNDQTGTVAVGDPVGYIYNQAATGSAADAEAATAGRRPTLQAESGKHYLLFDGTENHVRNHSNGEFLHSVERTFIIAGRFLPAAQNNRRFGGWQGAGGHLRDIGGNWYWQSNSGGSAVNLGVSSRTRAVVTLVRQSNNAMVARVNGAQVASFTNLATSQDGFALGTPANDSLANHGNIEVFGMAIANGIPADLAAVEAAFADLLP